MFGLGFGKRNKAQVEGQVGIVIGDDRLVAVHIRTTTQPPELLARLEVGGTPGQGLAALAEWVDARQLRGVPTALTLNYGSYAVQQIDKPDVADGELRQALRWRLKDLLDYSPADAVIDFFNTPPARQKRVEPLQVVAAQASVLKPWVAAIQAGGLDLQRIDIAEFALRNLVTQALGRREACAALFFLPQRGSLQICRDDQFYFSRTLDQGLEALARAASGSEFGGFADIDDRIALEAQRTMDYYDSHFGHAPVKTLLVIGQGSALQRLARYVTTALGISAQQVGATELVRGLDADTPVDPLFALALGGALGLA